MAQINRDAQSYIDSLRWGTKDPVQKAQEQSANNGALSQEDFFALITQQLAQQDPFKPSDNSDMVAQMVSMSTTESLGKMTKSFEQLREVMTSNQALQASSLIGRHVLLPTNKVDLVADEPASAVTVLGNRQVSNLRVTIEDEKGAVVKVINFQGLQSNNVDVTWDGTNTQGNPVAPGKYTMKAEGLYRGQGVDFPLVTRGVVESVTLGTTDTPSAIRVRGLGGFQLKDILEVGHK